MPPPKFSVVTCCYNQGRFLPDCFESVRAQRYEPFEHIVVDDGSTDNTREICSRYPHVRYIHQANAGQSAALNRGFAEATGEVIAWVNSDDYYEPGAFARVAREMEGADPRRIVAGAAKVVDTDGRYLWMLKNGRVSFTRLLMHPRLYPLNGWTVMPCQPSVFFHRRLYEEIGPLDTSLKYGMDYDYWLRALRRGYSFHYVPQIFSDYRYHATSHSNQGFDTFLKEWQDVSARHLAALSAPQRAWTEIWWAYARVESLFVRRHKSALQNMAQALAAERGRGLHRHPWPHMLAATTQAPWLAVMFVWHKLRGSPEQRLLALAERLRS